MEQLVDLWIVLFLLLIAGVAIGLYLKLREKEPSPEMRAKWDARKEWQAKRQAFELEVSRIKEIVQSSRDGSDQQEKALELLKGLRISHRQWGYLIVHADHNTKHKLKLFALEMQLAIAEGTVIPNEFNYD